MMTPTDLALLVFFACSIGLCIFTNVKSIHLMVVWDSLLSDSCDMIYSFWYPIICWDLVEFLCFMGDRSNDHWHDVPFVWYAVYVTSSPFFVSMYWLHHIVYMLLHIIFISEGNISSLMNANVLPVVTCVTYGFLAWNRLIDLFIDILF